MDIMNKKSLLGIYTQLPRIGYIHNPDKGNYVIYRYKHPKFIGMKFTDNKPPKPFQAVIQKSGSFTLDRIGYSLDEINYYKETPHEWYLHETEHPDLSRRPLSERLQQCVEFGHAILLSREELKQIQSGQIEKEHHMFRPDTLPAIPEGVPAPVLEPDTVQPKAPAPAPAPIPEEYVTAEIYDAFSSNEPEPKPYTIEEIDELEFSIKLICKNARLLPRDLYDRLNQLERIDKNEPTNHPVY